MEKLIWKCKHDTKFSRDSDFLEDILNSWGVSDIKGFLNPGIEHTHDPFLFKNMKEGIELLHKHLEKKSKIFVRADCDVDGFSSSSVLIQFIRDISPETEIKFALNYEKRHGLTYEDVSVYDKDEFGLFIVPDASMEAADAIDIKKYFSGDILVLDHHLFEYQYYNASEKEWIAPDKAKELIEKGIDKIEKLCYTDYCVAINCCDGQYPNDTLAGAGVVYKFLEAYCEEYGIDQDRADKYLDLVSLGCIADSMDLRNLETRYYTLKGLEPEYCNNLLITEMCKLFEEDMHFGRTIHNMGWVIAPKINGVIRYGEKDEQDDLFRAICGEEEERLYQPRRKHASDPKPDAEVQTLQKWMARVSRNVKDRQDSEVRKFMKEADAYITENGLNKNSILFVDGTSFIRKKTVTGLVANKLASKYLRPVVLLKSYNPETFGGSGRNYQYGPIENLNEWLTERGVNCAGHEGAFGVQVDKAKLPAIIERCNKDLPLDSLVTIHPVDYEIEARELKSADVEAVARNYMIWGGNTTPSPVFAIKNIRINSINIKAYGDTANFIRFVYNGIPFLKKYAPHNMHDQMCCRQEDDFGPVYRDVVMNIIGEFYLNEYEGKLIPQVKILYFDSEIDDENNREYSYEEIAMKKMKASDILKSLDDDDFEW